VNQTAFYITMKYLTLVLLTTATGLVLGQASNFNTQRNWSFQKKELTLGIGGTNFLGDLGGANAVGTDYSVKDWDFPSTSLGTSLAYRYRFHPYYATSFIVNFGRIRGNDAKTDEPVRNNRNLSFRSSVINVSQRFEVIILAKEKVGHRLRISGLKGMPYKNSQLYLFTGIGATYFNPKAQHPNGGWYDLRDMHTEGQGLPGGPAEYSRVTATIPFGLGMRMGVGKMWRIGLEFTYVKTFSDYIDDVHGVYYDPSIIAAEYGDIAAYFSNPGKNPSAFNPGSQRGDKQNDAIFYFNFTIARNLTAGRPPSFKKFGKPKFAKF